MAKYIEFKPKEITYPKAVVITPDAKAQLGFNPFEVYNQAKEKISEDFKGNERAIKILTNRINFQTLTGSQFFWNNYLNKVLPFGRTMNLKDLEKIYSFDENFFENHYSGTTNLCLRTENLSWKNNKHILENLVKQVKQRGKSFSSKNPLIISNFDFISDNNLDNFYGILLKLREDSILENDERFAYENNKIKLGVEKNLYTEKGDLSRVFANGSRNVNSNYGDLRDSDDGGWVVFVSDEVANAQKLNEYIQKLDKEKESQIRQIEERYVKSLNILKGKE